MELAITIGLPLSGKSSLCQSLKEEGYVIVSPDSIRLVLHGKQYEPLTEPFVWAVAQTMVRALLLEGHKVIVDATNTTMNRRKMWSDIAKEFELDLVGYWVTNTKEECIRRNNLIKRLDNSIIERMASQFEEPTELKTVRRVQCGNNTKL